MSEWGAMTARIYSALDGDRAFRHFPNMSDVLPDKASSGKYTIGRVSITPEGAEALAWRALINGNAWEFCCPGTFTVLKEDGRIWMSDTFSERISLQPWLRAAKGHVLVGGLGLGMLCHGLARFKAVTRMTVVEKDPDVITLAAQHLPRLRNGQSIRVTQADVYEYVPRDRIDTALYDVWPTIDSDNLAQMRKLEKRANEQGANKVLCWGKTMCQDMLVKEVAMRTTLEALLASESEADDANA